MTESDELISLPIGQAALEYGVYDARFRKYPELADCLYWADSLEDALEKRADFGSEAVVVEISASGECRIVEPREDPDA